MRFPLGVALNSLIKVDYFVEIVGGIVIMLLFVAAVGIVNDKVLESRALTTSIGYLSLTTESILALPALIANWRSKSCGNMRYAIACTPETLTGHGRQCASPHTLSPYPPP